MATYEQLMRAARNADQAGDAAAAKKLLTAAARARKAETPSSPGAFATRGLVKGAAAPVAAMRGALA